MDLKDLTSFLALGVSLFVWYRSNDAQQKARLRDLKAAAYGRYIAGISVLNGPDISDEARLRAVEEERIGLNLVALYGSKAVLKAVLDYGDPDNAQATGMTVFDAMRTDLGSQEGMTAEEYASLFTRGPA